VVDSSAGIAYFKGERNSAEFTAPVEDAEHLIVPSVSLTEVFRFISRHANERLALEAISHMKKGLVIPLDSTLAIEAAGIGLDLRLPLADSIIYATARKFNAVLWTQDAEFKDLPGVKYCQ